jgi:signal peptidase II
MVGLGLAVAVAILVADQATKYWILGLFAGQPPGAGFMEVTPFFNLVLTWNRGMSFGLFNTDAAMNALVFTVLAAVIVGGLLVWLRRVQDTLLALAIGLVIGGAVGNVIDRLLPSRGAVVDFLDFHLAGWHWFAFNLADAAICVGVGLMVIDSLLGRREAPN